MVTVAKRSKCRIRCNTSHSHVIGADDSGNVPLDWRSVITVAGAVVAARAAAPSVFNCSCRSSHRRRRRPRPRRVFTGSGRGWVSRVGHVRRGRRRGRAATVQTRTFKKPSFLSGVASPTSVSQSDLSTSATTITTILLPPATSIGVDVCKSLQECSISDSSAFYSMLHAKLGSGGAA